MKKMIFRHGDLLLEKISKLPNGLPKKEMNIEPEMLMEGSQGKPHLVQNGIFFPKKEDDFVFGYLKAEKGCVLLHEDHGEKVGRRKLKEAKLPVGFYKLRRQVEFTHEGMRKVED